MKKKVLIILISLSVLILLFALLIPHIYISNSRRVFKGFSPAYSCSYAGLYSARYELSAEDWDVVCDRIPTYYSLYEGKEAQNKCWMIKGIAGLSLETSESIDLGYISVGSSFFPSPFATYYEMIVRVPTDTGYSVYCLFDIKNNRTK